MITCAECGATHYPGTLFCDTCGAAVHPAARAQTAAIDHRPRTADDGRQTTPEPIALRVRLPYHDTALTVRGALIHVGRADPDAGFTPELDLAPYGGQERGVSRRHATIRWREGGYALVDEHSSNGTWLDGARLAAGRPYPLPDRATVRFGGLLVQLAIAD